MCILPKLFIYSSFCFWWIQSDVLFVTLFVWPFGYHVLVDWLIDWLIDRFYIALISILHSIDRFYIALISILHSANLSFQALTALLSYIIHNMEYICFRMNDCSFTYRISRCILSTRVVYLHRCLANALRNCCRLKDLLQNFHCENTRP